MGEQERLLMVRRLRVAYVSVVVAVAALLVTVLFSVRAWAALPESVERNSQHIESHEEVFFEIRERLARIEAKLDAHLEATR